MNYIPNFLEKPCPTNKITYDHLDEIWSIDLADFSDYKVTKIKGLNIYLL